MHATRGTCFSAFPSQAWFILSQTHYNVPVLILSCWCTQPYLFLLASRIPSFFPSFLPPLGWNPHLRLLAQLYFPLAESLPSLSPSSSPVSLTVQSPCRRWILCLLPPCPVSALPQSSHPEKPVSPSGFLHPVPNFCLVSSEILPPIPLPDWLSNQSHIGEPDLTPLSQFSFLSFFNIKLHLLNKLVIFLIVSPISVIP